MAAKVIERLMNFFGFDEQEDESIEEKVENEIPFNKKPKIVNIHTQSQIKVIILKPENFEQAQTILDNIKNKKPMIIDLQNMERNDAQRLIDFLSGAIFALNGEIKKIANSIFLIVPDNFDIAGDIQDEVDSMFNLK
ncbi:MAG: cell division inhibitor SepF [Thermoanaerobacterium sp.]|uniref:cell division protein SepF n=1 Tax=Thermoanaerobacterium sp. CMT5567-10 TaxID=3061989 RepID=UPI0024AB1089|nr:cell division protein SepF [Thermoanaerobacterium sp. CMT5567-10]MDI3478320.1 cell division inhibitor SepF [Thermoanaerobacterium sp.]WKV08854.1 cell division protein SepF [Thermoanaerobacterium sp. CMT5567-10]